jgi:RimJ/RimL family protein N-acetyltransferase
MGAAYYINTERLLLRCLDFKDAYELKAAIDESKDNLLKWMAWAKHEPEDIDKKLERIRTRRFEFDSDQAYQYGIFLHGDDKLIGTIALMRRIGEGALEIGYWLRTGYTNKGYMNEAASALVKIAFELHEVERVEIHCDVENLKSAAIPRKLGFAHEATIRSNEKNDDGTRKKSMIWMLFKEEYENSKLKDLELESYDAAQRRITRRTRWDGNNFEDGAVNNFLHTVDMKRDEQFV